MNSKDGGAVSRPNPNSECRHDSRKGQARSESQLLADEKSFTTAQRFSPITVMGS